MFFTQALQMILQEKYMNIKITLLKDLLKKYRVDKLVYYEVFDDPDNAISREKQIKAGSRKKKVELIDSFNKEWKDLYEGIL